MAGTFATIPLSPTGDVYTSPSLGSRRSSISQASSSADLSSPKFFRVSGKSLNLDALDDTKDKTVGTAPRLDDSDDDSQDDDDDTPEPEFRETFTFSRNIRNPEEVLVGPPTKTTQAADYLRLIGMDTDTECSLVDRVNDKKWTQTMYCKYSHHCSTASSYCRLHGR